MARWQRLGLVLALTAALLLALPGCASSGGMFDVNGNGRSEWYETTLGIICVVGFIWLIVESDDGSSEYGDEYWLDDCRLLEDSIKDRVYETLMRAV